MARILVLENVSLDGVMQAPGRPDEDAARRVQLMAAGPRHTTMPSSSRSWAEGMAQGGAPAVRADGPTRTSSRSGPGARTTRSRGARQFAEVRRLANAERAAAVEELHAAQRRGGETVAQLKRQTGKDLLVMGSGELVQSLQQHGLVDEFLLLIHPLVLGPVAACSRTTARMRPAPDQLCHDDHRCDHRKLSAGRSNGLKGQQTR